MCGHHAIRLTECTGLHKNPLSQVDGQHKDRTRSGARCKARYRTHYSGQYRVKNMVQNMGHSTVQSKCDARQRRRLSLSVMEQGAEQRVYLLGLYSLLVALPRLSFNCSCCCKHFLPDSRLLSLYPLHSATQSFLFHCSYALTNSRLLSLYSLHSTTQSFLFHCSCALPNSCLLSLYLLHSTTQSLLVHCS